MKQKILRFFENYSGLLTMNGLIPRQDTLRVVSVRGKEHGDSEKRKHCVGINFNVNCVELKPDFNQF